MLFLFALHWLGWVRRRSHLIDNKPHVHHCIGTVAHPLHSRTGEVHWQQVAVRIDELAGIPCIVNLAFAQIPCGAYSIRKLLLRKYI